MLSCAEVSTGRQVLADWKTRQLAAMTSCSCSMHDQKLHGLRLTARQLDCGCTAA